MSKIDAGQIATDVMSGMDQTWPNIPFEETQKSIMRTLMMEAVKRALRQQRLEIAHLVANTEDRNESVMEILRDR